MKSAVLALVITIGLLHGSRANAQSEPPKVSDPRLVVELVAADPDIVHPIACDFDAKGRLLVIESHTHFAPKDYKGPKVDRIRMMDPSLTLQARKFTTFYEGTRHTMDLAVHPDGSVYVATRSEILRLRDNGKGVADKGERIVFLDTKGDYPHNGLSGLCFDSKGDLYFGMGEHLGAKYTLIGSNGVKFSGEGDGGHIFHCSADGKYLRRVATGFWNQFGICRDIYGRVFAVDNDPDQAPPCRMLHVVEGGDYGFRFMYGRSGKHPFQSWHGELPGTLPMMTGVGEAPCEILSYESDGLPKEYLGKLMVTSWADHRVEMYKVVPHGASFKAERQPFVQGPSDFRPTGMCIAPDGSLYVCDWVKSDYTLHGKGAIWHIREKQSRERKRPVDPKEAIFSVHRPLREAAANKLAADKDGRQFLRTTLQEPDGRAVAAAFLALLDATNDPAEETKIIAEVYDHPDLGIVEMAAAAASVRRADFIPKILVDPKHPRLWADAIKFMKHGDMQRFLDHPDPFLRHFAVLRLAEINKGIKDEKNAKHRVAILLAAKRLVDNGRPDEFFPDADADETRYRLEDADEEVRFLAVKWIADVKVKACRKDVEKLMVDPKLSVRMYLACATALARIDGQEVSETKLADYFAKRLADDKTLAAQRAMLLRQVPASHKLLTIPLLQKLADSEDAALKREAVRALVDHPSTLRHVPLRDVYASPSYGTHLRAYALLGMMDLRPEEFVPMIMPDVTNPKSKLRTDAERALLGFEIKPGKPFERPLEKGRPSSKDIDAWLKRLDGLADPEAGERIFFHAKVGTCAKCHRIDGRGADVGPDLSSIGRTERRHILGSILQPSGTIAPRYVPWLIETKSGKTLTGMLLHTHLDEYTFLDAQGGRFKVKTGDIGEQRAATTSIMPDGLVERLTDQELRDLLAYLQSRK